jgi:hypothetical protein
VLKSRGQQALERYYEAFEQGILSAERCEQRLTRLQARPKIFAPNKPNSPSKRHMRAHTRPPPPTSPTSPTTSNASWPKADPQRAKALLGLLIEERRVNGRAEIQPTYRLVTPTVRAMSEKVERTGIEPVTSALQRRRSPS